MPGLRAGLPGAMATDLVQGTYSYSHGDTIDAVTAFEGADSLEHGGRQLTAFVASEALFQTGGLVLNAFLGAGASATLNELIGGSSAVPVNLGEVIASAIVEINAAVKQSINEVCT